MKKHILLLTTGGTIASLPGGEGLEPQRSTVMDTGAAAPMKRCRR